VEGKERKIEARDGKATGEEEMYEGYAGKEIESLKVEISNNTVN
jgi:hypothetical protein